MRKRAAFPLTPPVSSSISAQRQRVTVTWAVARWLFPEASRAS
jgi:hypothetical protein